MAAAAVSSAINTLVPLLVDEAKLLRNVRNEVASIKAELESIKSFLKDAESRAETGNEGAKTWVKQVREVAYQIEDVIDEYVLHLSEQRQRRGFISFLKKAARSIIKLKPRHKIASQIQDIKTTIHEIKERADRNRFSAFEQGSSSNTKDSTWHDPRVASLFIGEDEVVGIESPREELIGRMLAGESERKVISLIGMAGIGKTTLAKKVYDSLKDRACFDCYSWIPVSQSYNTEELLRRMIKQLCQSREEREPEGIEAMDQNSLINKLRKYLLQKRYLIVFDDVWRTDFWGFIKNALPRNNKGNGVIITTRSAKVAAFCKESLLDHIYELQPLPEEEAWKLFSMKAFQRDFGGRCPPELVKVSREIVKKCEGLPLAIVTIGCLLCTKDKDASEWNNFYHSLGSELERNPHLTSITKIVLLSYYDLPYYLKSCFLYFGIIPEDYSISCGRLIRLWIAEGFVEERRGKTLEQVAEEYLIELIHRGLVQVSEKLYGGRVKSCRVHDVVHEIILSMCDELSFCHVLTGENSSFNDRTRRLSMHKKVLESISESSIRSVFLFAMAEPTKKPLLGMLAQNFKLLKVLDLEDAPLDQLDEEVGILFHLRYLSLRHTKVKIIPKSIGKLYNLQTLDLKYSLVCELPIEINRLRKLRHLFAVNWNYGLDYSMDTVRGVKVHGGIGHLEELQKLWAVEANHYGLNLIKELENLRKLRKLGITKLQRENGRALGTAIEKMEHLKDLKVWAISEDEILDLQSISFPPESLESLTLAGRLEMLPDWIPKLQNLGTLNLAWSSLTDDPLEALQALPNLLSLTLYQACSGELLHFKVGGFQKVKVLSLNSLKGLSSVIIEEGALPLLRALTIGPCPQLKEVPSGIHHLRELGVLEFYDMPSKFLDRMNPKEGQDYWIVENILSVKFFSKCSGANYEGCYIWEFFSESESQTITEAQNQSES